MKKILYSIIAISGLLFTSCLSFDDPVTENYGAGPAVTIKVTETTDSTFTFTVTPADGTQYYSVLVDEAAVADSSIVASSLLSGSYSGVYGKVLNATDAKSFTFNMRDASGTPLASPNSVYQIYAVAANDKGIVGEVAFASATTTDQLAPRPVQYQFYEEDKAMVVAFSEALTRGEGAVKVSYYAHNELMAGAINPVEVPTEEIVVQVEGNEIAIIAPTTPDGAWVTYSWEAGAFVDVVGHSCSAFTSTFDPNAFDFVGLVGRNALGTFAITDANITAPEHGSVIENWETFLGTITLDYKVYPVSAVAENAFSVTYTGAKSVKTITLDSESWAVNGNIIYFVLPEAPAPGDIVTVSIAEGAVTDAYGSSNEAFKSTEAWWKMFDFVATEDMVLGSFNGVGVSAYDGGSYSLGENILIERAASYDGYAEFDIPSDGKAVIVSNLLQEGSQVIGYFNLDEATVYVVAAWRIGDVAMTDGTVYGSVTYSISGNDWIPFKINSDGTLTSDDLAWVACDTEYTSLVGYLDKFSMSTLTKNAETPAAVTTSSVKKAAFGKVNVKAGKSLKSLKK